MEFGNIKLSQFYHEKLDKFYVSEILAKSRVQDTYAIYLDIIRELKTWQKDHQDLLFLETVGINISEEAKKMHLKYGRIFSKIFLQTKEYIKNNLDVPYFSEENTKKLESEIDFLLLQRISD